MHLNLQIQSSHLRVLNNLWFDRMQAQCKDLWGLEWTETRIENSLDALIYQSTIPSCTNTSLPNAFQKEQTPNLCNQTRERIGIFRPRSPWERIQTKSWSSINTRKAIRDRKKSRQETSLKSREMQQGFKPKKQLWNESSTWEREGLVRNHLWRLLMIDYRANESPLAQLNRCFVPYIVWSSGPMNREKRFSRKTKNICKKSF